MSKKRQRIPKPLTRKQLSRREREQRLRRAALIGTAVVLGLALVVLGIGLYDQYVLKPKKPVATVAGEIIPLAEYQKLVRFRRADLRSYLNQLEARKLEAASREGQDFLVQLYDQQIEQVKRQLRDVPGSVLEELIEDRLIRQECARRGIEVSAEEVEVELERQFGYDRNPPTPTPTPITHTLPVTVTPTATTPPMTFEEFQQQSSAYFEAIGQATGFTEQDFRRLIEDSLYRRKLAEALKAEVPTSGEQVHARHILVETREQAEEVLQKLKQGEDFATLAQEYSTDSGSKDQGGDLGWFPRGKMVTEFEEAAFSLQPGEISDIVQTRFGFHIIQVLERDENRPYEPADLERIQREALDQWLTQRRTSPDVIRSWDSTMIPPDTGG